MVNGHNRADKNTRVYMGNVRKTRQLAAVAGVALAIAGAGGTARAQDVAPAADAASDQAPIVVTGSRIRSPEFSQSNPVQALTSQAIEESGKTNLTEFLVNSPALLASTRSIDNAGSNLAQPQEAGSNFLNLRNLGSERTLVLVDGRRHVSGTPYSAAVDINTIPTDLVERVDVLTGGVSAIYGADGVSGVVNFIMKKDFEGLRLRAQNTISQRGDAGERFAAATFGKNFADGRGNVTLAYEFNETDRFSQKQRLNYGLTGPSYSLQRNPADGTPGTPADNPAIPDRVLMTGLRWADSSPGGAIFLFGNPFPDFTGEGTPYNTGTYVPGTPFTIGGDSTPRESYYGDYTPYTRKHIANLLAHFEFSPALTVYAEAKYVRSTAWTEYQPTYDLFTQLAPDNAYLIQKFGAAASANGALFSRDNFDFGTRRYQMDRNLFRGVLGGKGELSDHLSYDASFVFGQSTQRATSYGDRIADRYYAALDAVTDANGNITCRINLPGQTDVIGNSFGNSVVFNGPPVTFKPGECVPLNILGNGSPSKAALNWVLANHSDYARIRQYVASFSLSGDTGAFLKLPGGPIGFAAGAEYRKESLSYQPSAYSLQGALIDSSPTLAENGAFDVKEAFAEVRLPLLAHVPFAHELSLGGALRLSDYSTSGSTTTWNVKSTWAPVRDVAFRGTYSRSVRAPNINELYAPQNGGFSLINDPCGIDRVGEGSATRAANCATALNALGVNPATFDPANSPTSPGNSSLLGTQGGNPGLKPEVAKTWTAGVVLRPRIVPELTVSMDWYDINLTSAIRTSTAQNIVDLCYDQPTLNNEYCSLIARSSTTGFISNYRVIPQNVASYRTAGLDFTVAWRKNLSDKLGTLALRLSGNYLDKLAIVPSLGATPINQVDNGAFDTALTYPAPRWSAMFDATWIKGPFTLNYGINWWAKTRRVSREQEAANPDYAPAQYIWYKEKWLHELFMSYDVADKFQIYGGVNNLLDTKPDDGAVAYPVDAIGRSFYLGVKAKVF